MNGDSGNRPVFGSQSSDELFGTSDSDHLFGMKGDDILDGGLGADVYNGGAGNDRYVLSDDAIDTLHFRSNNTQQDILDISELVPSGVDSGNLKNYLKVTDKGVYLDSAGQGQFSTENQIARFAANNPPLNAMIAVQVADTSVIQFDRFINTETPVTGLSAEENASTSLNDVEGTDQVETLTGTSSGDKLTARGGDDTLIGGEGADYYDGGEGNDRYVLTDTESIDTLKFISNAQQQDVIDVSALIPSGVTAETLGNYIKVTEDGVYLDAEGEGEFSSEDLIAVFAEDNPVFSDEISIQISEETVVQFDWTQNAGVELTDDTPFLSTETLNDKLDLFDQVGGGKRAFLNSKDGQRFHFKLDDHNLTKALGGEGDELLDASTVSKRGQAQKENEADHAVELFGGKGRDTLRGNDDGTMLDGGEGNDRIEAGKGRNLLIGGSGEDEYALSLESSADEIKSDMLYDFTSKSGDRDILDLKEVLSEDVTAQNIHSYVKVTDEGVFIDTTGKAHFNEESQLARFGERADLDNIVRIKLADGSGVELNRDEAINSIQGESTADKMKAGEGSDTLYGNAGDDILDGDALASTKSADFLYGGEGNDKLYIDGLDLSAGAVDGGVGFDTARIKENSGVSVTLDMHSSGIEKAIGGGSDDVLDGSGFTDTSGGYNKSSGAFDSSEAQRLDLYGRDGNDTLRGGVGRDYLDGGADDDILSGGDGRDFVAGGAGNDTFILADDEHVDTLWDFKSTDDQTDVLDISALVSDSFDYNDLGNYLNVDDTYVYFDSAGEGTFTYSQAIAKLGGKSVIDNPINVQLNDIQVTFDPNGGDIVLLNTNAPTAIASGQTIAEDSAEGTSVGSVSHTDIDGPDPVTYAISGGNENGYFTINSATGAVSLTAAGAAAIDYESVASHTIQVTASDGTLISSEVDLTVTLSDVNEAPIVANVIGHQSVAENTQLVFQVPENTFTDVDGDTLSYSAALADGGELPDWLQFDTETRTFSGTPDNNDAGDLNLRVTATDPDGESVSAQFSLEVIDVNSAPVLAESPLFDSVVAAYNFSDGSGSTATDTSGAGHDIALSGSASFGTGHGGTGTAFEMDGNSGGGDLGAITTGGAMTISAWVKYDSFDQSWSRIVDLGNGSEDNNIVLAHDDTTNDLAFHIYPSTGNAGKAEIIVEDFFTAGEWVHLTATVDQSGVMRVYKNGDMVAEETNGAVPVEMVRNNNLLGQSNWGDSDGSLDGSIDDLAIFDNVLSASQVKALYQADSVDNLLDDSLHVVENSSDSTVIGTVSSTDIDGDTLTYSLTENAGGRFAINSSTGEITVADGSLLNHEANGSHEITVQVSDGALASTRTYTVYVTDVNEAPVTASVDLGSTNEDTDVVITQTQLLANASDVDGDTLAVTSLSLDNNSHGTLTDNGNGTWTFSPAANFNGNDIGLTFEISDGQSGTTNGAATIDVTSVADAAVISGTDSGSVQEDSASSLVASGSLSVTDVDAGEASFTAETVTGTYGSVTIDADGNWSYSADNSQAVIQELAVGETLTDTLTVRSFDGTTKNISITIQGADDAPVVSNVDLGSMNEDSSILITQAELLANASDIDGDILSVSSISIDDSAHGALADNGDNTWTFTPASNFNGADVAFSYTVTDGTSGDEANVSAVIDVNAVDDDAIVANPVSNQSINEDSVFNFIVPENTFSHGDNDTLTYTASQADGSALPGWLSFDAENRVFSGTPDNEDVATINLKVTATDEDGETTDASFNLVVNNINDAPSPVFAEESGLISIEAEHYSSNVSRSGDTWTVVSDGSASEGQAITTPDDNGDGFNEGYIGNSAEVTYDIQFDAPGTYYVWILGKEAHGSSDSVHIGLNGEPVSTGHKVDFDSSSMHWVNDRMDGGGRISIEVDEAGVHQFNLWLREDGTTVDKIVISNDVNYVPSGTGPAESGYVGGADQAVAEEAAFSYTIDANSFKDADGDALSYSATLSNGDPLPSWMSFDGATRTFSGTPDDADIGAVQVRVTASDGSLSSSVDVNITVTSVNDAPVANVDSLAINEGQTLSLDVLANDTDADSGDTLSLDSVVVVDDNGDPVSGKGIATIVDGKLQFNTNGEFASLGDGETEEVSVRYTISDSSGAQSTSTVTVTVTGANEAPVANSVDLGSTNEDTAISITKAQLLANTTDSGGDVLSITSLTLDNNAHGSLQDNGDDTWTFTPAANFNGNDVAFSFTVSDGELTASTSATIDVTSVNDAANLTADSDSGNASVSGSAITGGASVLANDSDVEGDSLSITEVNGTSVSESTVISGDFGDLTISEDGSWTYNPADTSTDIDLDSDLIAHWTFNETSGTTAADTASGDAEANDGELNHGATFVSGGREGNAVQFDGENSIIDLVDSSELNTYSGSRTERTINFDFKLDASNDLSGRQILFEEGGDGKGYNIYIDEGTLYVGTWSSSGSQGSWLATDISSMDDSQWHQVSLVFDGDNNTQTAYLDGDVFGTGSAPSEMTFHGDEASFGSISLHNNDGNITRGSTRFHDGGVNAPADVYGFEGLIDEARIYDRALNNQEINALNYEFQNTTLQDVFTYTVSDGADTSISTLTIDVNRVPEALSGTLSGSDAGVIAGQLSATDRDVGETLTYSLETAPAKGSVTVNTDGSYSFNPGADFESLSTVQTEDVTFNFRVTDSQGDSSVSTITVTVTGTNVAPELADLPANTLQINENSANNSIVGSVSATDANSDSLTYQLTNDAGGRFTINSSTGEISVADGSLLDFEAASSHSVTVQVSDGYLTDTHDYTINVTDLNDAPDSADSTVTVNEDSQLTLSVADFSFQDEDAGDVLSGIVIKSLPTVGALSLNGSAVTVGQSVSKADVESGLLTFTPVANASGDNYANFTFAVSDGQAESATQTLSVNVTPVSDAPTLTVGTTPVYEELTETVHDAQFGTDHNGLDGWAMTEGNIEDDKLRFDVDDYGILTRTIDISDDDLSYTLDLNAVLNDGRVRVYWDGDLITSSSDFYTTQTYSPTINLPVPDGGTAELRLELTANPGSVRLNDVRLEKTTQGEPYFEANEDEALALSLSAALSDADNSESLSVTLSGIPTGYSISDGSNSSTSTGAAIDVSGWELNQLQLTPLANSNGNFTLTVSATATESGNSDSSTVTEELDIRFMAVNDRPEAEDGQLVLGESGSYAFETDDFVFSDVDTGDTLQSITITSLPDAGALTLNGAAVTANQVINVSDISNLSYTAGSGPIGHSVSFGFTVSDGTQSSTTQTFGINVVGDSTAVVTAVDFNGSDPALASDASGNGNNVSLSGSASLGTGHNGSGTALEMDGSEGYGELSGVSTGGAMTISMWARYDSFDERWSRLVDFGNGSSNNNIVLAHEGATDTLAFHIYPNSDSSGKAELEIENFFTAGEWVHITATVDESGVMRVYKNGELEGENLNGAVPAEMVRTDNYIGKSTWGDDPLDGAVDELMIFDQALDASQAQQLYQLDTVQDTLTAIGDGAYNGTADSDILQGSDGNDILSGLAGADTLLGGDGADQIIGGAGNDILSGGSGSDMFIWNVDDLGSAGSPAEDTITDFLTGSGGDVIDLSDVLVDDSEPLENYLSLNFENGDTTIEVKPDANGDVTQKIKLEGVDLSGYGGGSSDSEILNNLIDDGNLQVD